MRFCIVGAGKVGSALARLLSQAGWEFLGAASRSLESAERACRFAGCGRPSTDAAKLTRAADLIFITVPDDAISSVCRELAEAGGISSGAVVAHCSGAHSSSVLEDARGCGGAVGSMHPLQSFATAEQAVRLLPGAYCCIEGDPSAVEVLREAAGAMGAKVLAIPAEGKALYHAAAVMACNYLVALESCVQTLLFGS